MILRKSDIVRACKKKILLSIYQTPACGRRSGILRLPHLSLVIHFLSFHTMPLYRPLFRHQLRLSPGFARSLIPLFFELP